MGWAPGCSSPPVGVATPAAPSRRAAVPGVLIAPSGGRNSKLKFVGLGRQLVLIAPSGGRITSGGWLTGARVRPHRPERGSQRERGGGLALLRRRS